MTRPFIAALVHRSKEDGISFYAAALSFYAIFAIAPTVIIVVALSGFFFDSGALETVSHAIGRYFGSDAERFLEATAERGLSNRGNAFAAGLAILIFLYAIARFFDKTRHAFFSVFEVALGGRQTSIKKTIAGKILSALYTLFFILLFLVATAVIVFVANIFNISLVGGLDAADSIRQITTIMVAFMSVMFLITSFYRMFSGGSVPLQNAFYGAMIATILFVPINLLLSLYIKLSIISSLYGAAASLLAVLLWFYYSALALLVGAEAAKLFK